MSKVIAVIAATAGVALTIGGAVLWKTVVPRAAANQLARSEDGLQRIAAEANRGLPKFVDEETRLNRISASGRTLIYDYDMPNYRAADLDLKVFHDKLEPDVKTKACSMKETRDMFLDNGDTLRYHYVDKDGLELTTIDVTQADCLGSATP